MKRGCKVAGARLGETDGCVQPFTYEIIFNFHCSRRPHERPVTSPLQRRPRVISISFFPSFLPTVLCAPPPRTKRPAARNLGWGAAVEVIHRNGVSPVNSSTAGVNELQFIAAEVFATRPCPGSRWNFRDTKITRCQFEYPNV